MQNIRIGFIGLGGICRHRHVPGLQKIDGVELTAVVNRSRESSERAAKEFGIPHVCETAEELIARDDIDAAVIGTWPYMHKPLSIAALEAGKHVFCQARMAMNFGEARAMYHASEKAGLVAMLCPVPFGLSVGKTIAKILARGDLGDVTLVRVQSLANMFVDPNTHMNWRKDHRLSGINMHTLGMYIEVIHRWFGWTQSVSAESHIFTQQRPDETGQLVDVEIPDEYLVHSTTASGIPAQYTISTVAHHATDAIHVHGTKGTLFYDVFPDKLYFAEAGADLAPVAIESADAYDVENWRVEQDFIDAIRESAEYHPNFEDGLRYMQVLQAAHDSATSGNRIKLDLA